MGGQRCRSSHPDRRCTLSRRPFANRARNVADSRYRATAATRRRAPPGSLTRHPIAENEIAQTRSRPSHMRMQKRERHPRDAILSELRIGMGVAKGHAPAWIKTKIPDAPSVAIRFSPSPTAEGISLAARTDDEVDILFTAGGHRLWKLLWNL